MSIGHGKRPLLKIIRDKCLDCCCQLRSEVRNCIIPQCPLWPYRMGTNPFRISKAVTEKQKIALEQGRFNSASNMKETNNEP